MRATTPMTVEEFLALPYPELGRQEFIGGEVVMSDPDPSHQLVVVNLITDLTIWCRAEAGRGTAILNIDIEVGRDIMQPDLQWYPGGSSFRGRPEPLGDLVIEVRSPSTWARDVGVKRAAYEAHGAQEVWLVDHLSRTVLVYRRSTREAPGFDVAFDLGEDDALESPLLPGLRVPLAAIFP